MTDGSRGPAVEPATSTQFDLGERMRTFAVDVRRSAEPHGLPQPADLMTAVVRAVPATDHASLTVIRTKQRPETIASSDDTPFRADLLQYELGEGPCLDAADHAPHVRSDDLSSDRRWRVFGPRAVADTSVRSVFSTQLPLSGNNRAALNLYSDRAAAFDDVDVDMIGLSRSWFSMAVDHHLEQTRSANLEVALQTSRQIGMALGIIMSSRLLTADQAFQAMVHTSQQTHRKLRDIALDVMETGTLPDLPDRRRG